MYVYFIAAVVFLIAVILLNRGNASPYKNTIQRQFIPLNHLEIEQKKPFIWKLCPDGENPKWVYECNLAKTSTLAMLWESKDLILELNEEKFKYRIEKIAISLTQLLWVMGEKPRGLIKKARFKIFFFKYCYQNIELLIKVFNEMLDYQSRIFFLLKNIKTKLLTQEKEYIRTDGDPSAPAQKPGPRYISNIFLKWNSKKSKGSIKAKSSQKSRPGQGKE